MLQELDSVFGSPGDAQIDVTVKWFLRRCTGYSEDVARRTYEIRHLFVALRELGCDGYWGDEDAAIADMGSFWTVGTEDSVRTELHRIQEGDVLFFLKQKQ